MDKKELEDSSRKNDFTQGTIAHNIMSLALPMTLAQLINILYNIIDRMYIGHIEGAGALALTGLGLTFPIITIITAFANLFGMGGAPLCSIARGQGDHDRAGKIMGNSFSLMIIFGILLTGIGLAVKEPLLYTFGASSATYPYADAYITIYLFGTIFVMTGLGMNSFINSQGFGKIGMMTVILGAFVNLILDPILIFRLHMGVKGAALATVLSQVLSAIWVFCFLNGKKAIIKLTKNNLKLKWNIVKDIISLGMSGFVMAMTNSIVQIVCNSNLQFFGGDLYVGVMTIINSVREVLSMPVNGFANGAQPVMGYNYGAGEYKRVRQCIKFTAFVCTAYTVLGWLTTLIFPDLYIRIFNNNAELIKAGIPSMRVYFMGFCFMALQLSGQSTFVSLGKSKQAVFFSLFRKVIVVVPLTYLLPTIGNLGVMGVFLAEPISNVIGGCACFGTVMLTVWRSLKKAESI